MQEYLFSEFGLSTNMLTTYKINIKVASVEHRTRIPSKKIGFTFLALV